MTPANGLYLTDMDFRQYQDYIADRIHAYDAVGHPDEAFRDSNKIARNVTFVVTERCNLCCTYCYETHKTDRRMTREIAKQAVDCILDESMMSEYYNFEDSPAVILEFIGGEPLLEIDLIDYTVEYFKKRALELDHPWGVNYMISISTNGVLYETQKVQDFLRRNTGRVSIGITIDGNKELHDACRLFPDGRGSYDIVESAIKSWLRYEPSAQTKITLAPQNIAHLNDAIRNIYDLGIQGAFVNCVFEKGWELEHAKIMYREMISLADWMLEDERYARLFCYLFNESIGGTLEDDRNWCGGNGDMLAIAPDGRLYPCIRFMDYALNNRKGTPIGDIWHGVAPSNEFLKCMQCITMSSQCKHDDNKKCLSCPIASGCALCTGYNYDYYGDPNHKATFICDMHRARVLANVYYWNKLYGLLGMDRRFDMNLDKETAMRIVSEDEYDRLVCIAGGD